jgi:hypothetical protein
MDRRPEVERFRRNLAMLRPGGRDAVGREHALQLLAELGDVQGHLDVVKRRALGGGEIAGRQPSRKGPAPTRTGSGDGVLQGPAPCSASAYWLARCLSLGQDPPLGASAGEAIEDHARTAPSSYEFFFVQRM